MSVADIIRAENGFDPFDLNAPFETWERLREEQPVFFHEPTGYFVVTRHADVKAVFDDWQTFSSENAQAPMRPMCEEGRRVMKEGGFTAYSGLSARVPPDHTRIRKIVQGCFGPRRFKSIEPKIEAIIDRQLNRVAPQGGCDFFRDVAYEVPALVLFALMGIPDSDVPKVKEWAVSRALLTWGNLSDAEQIPHAHKMVEYWAYCRALVAARKQEPGDDLPSDLVRLQAEGAEISDEEIAGVMYSVLFAGHETTTTLMANGVISLMSDRAQWAALCADPGLIPAATEEVLRYSPSIVAWRRRAKADTRINVKGVWQVSRALTPLMRAGGGGAIVNVSSATVFSGSPQWLHYVASKGAVIAMTRAMARELGDDNIRVNVLAPGFTLTEASLGLMEDAASYGVTRGALKRAAGADDMVGGALYLASSLAGFVTGQTLIVDGGRQFN